ncbi:ubiquitin carboxyl-terminal hydrolase 47-like [Enoplosus armatus]|uniref:ubiquitin carboxyl-terminal hydrolase 47-like n=1 Tax=Enoplosus armatus TaxID=215367 RepID=UPI003993B02D
MKNSGKRSLEDGRAAERKKQKVTQPQKLHHGLYNQGATCYLNSVLQVLFTTTEIHDRLHPKSQVTNQELRNIFEKLEQRTCGTENLTRSLDIKNVNEQRDAAECLELILRKISPRASEVFLGELRYTTKCSKGHSINEETNPFWTLPLSLKDAHDTTLCVQRGLESIFQTKSFRGDNMVYCNECKKKTEATSGCEMVKSPQILTLLLKRFDFDYDTMSHVKSNCYVDVPHALQIKNKTYKLYGMVNHMGSLRGGHYTATVLSNEDQTWYEFDDAHVKKVKEQPFAKSGTYNSSTAYLLVYRASGSLRDKVKERQGEIHHLEEQRQYRLEHKRTFKERDADYKEIRQNQESRGQTRKERKKEALSHQVRGEERDEIREMNVSTLNRNVIEEEALLHQNQNTSYSSKHLDSRTTPEERTQRSKKEEGDEKGWELSTTLQEFN